MVSFMPHSSNSNIPTVSSLYTAEVSLNCPLCGATEDGFTESPAGQTHECDTCGESYQVHPDADIEFGYVLG